ncbi:MAG: HDOD domain-containing protein, partial [Burkholderiales bacterium]|nr:HDOD domain-containing protein [Phycisphaerae bacterium]
PIFRDPIAACLRLAGHETACAASGKEGVAKARNLAPGLIILDMVMPEMDGLQVLAALRASPETAKIPVFILSALADRDHILKAHRLGAREYMLKSRFSADDLIARVEKHVRPNLTSPSAGKHQGSTIRAEARDASTVKAPSSASPVTSAHASPATSAPAQSANGTVPAVVLPATAHAVLAPKSFLTREDCIERVTSATAGKALGGVVSQVMTVATSPLGDAIQLASLISRDPVLASRVLAIANSAAYATRGICTTVLDAVRKVGFSSVRNIAAAVGIFDAVPLSRTDGFDALRCWQHSFAVATLCEQIERARDPAAGSEAYIAGLCHDLGELLVHVEFAEEYTAVRAAQIETGRPITELQREMLGMTHLELMLASVAAVKLPDAIWLPIQNYHRATRVDEETQRRADLLQLTHTYANGLLLAIDPDSSVRCFTREACKRITGKETPKQPDPQQFCAEVTTMTTVLAKLDSAAARSLVMPFKKCDRKVYLVRDVRLSEFDPIFTALTAIAAPELCDEFPAAALASDADALCVVVSGGAISAPIRSAIAQARNQLPGLDHRLMCIVGEPPDAAIPDPTNALAMVWPVSLQALNDFVAKPLSATSA